MTEKLAGTAAEIVGAALGFAVVCAKAAALQNFIVRRLIWPWPQSAEMRGFSLFFCQAAKRKHDVCEDRSPNCVRAYVRNRRKAADNRDNGNYERSSEPTRRRRMQLHSYLRGARLSLASFDCHHQWLVPDKTG